MKTKIKRHSRSVISVLLSVCMLISCMTVGLIATDAARISADESVGYGNCKIRYSTSSDSYSSASDHSVSLSSNKGSYTISNATASTTYYFKIKGDSDVFGNASIGTNYNTDYNLGLITGGSLGDSNGLCKFKTTTAGDYKIEFKLSGSSGSTVKVVKLTTTTTECSSDRQYIVTGSKQLTNPSQANNDWHNNWDDAGERNQFAYDSSIKMYKLVYTGIAANSSDPDYFSFRILRTDDNDTDWETTMGFAQGSGGITDASNLLQGTSKTTAGGDNNFKFSLKAKANITIYFDDSQPFTTSSIQIVVTPAESTLTVGSPTGGSVSITRGTTTVSTVDDTIAAIPYEGEVTLKATPDTNYTFGGWPEIAGLEYVGDTSSNEIVARVVGSATVTANFTAASFNITKDNAHCTITAPNTAPHSSAVTVSATAESGWYIDGLYYTIGSDATTHTIYGSATHTFDTSSGDQSIASMPQGNITIHAWTHQQGHQTIHFDDEQDGGYVSVGEEFTHATQPYIKRSFYDGNEVYEGTSVRFCAMPKSGYYFVGWYDNDEFTGDPVSTDLDILEDVGSSGSLNRYAKFESLLSSDSNVRRLLIYSSNTDAHLHIWNIGSNVTGNMSNTTWDSNPKLSSYTDIGTVTINGKTFYILETTDTDFSFLLRDSNNSSQSSEEPNIKNAGTYIYEYNNSTTLTEKQLSEYDWYYPIHYNVSNPEIGNGDTDKGVRAYSAAENRNVYATVASGNTDDYKVLFSAENESTNDPITITPNANGASFTMPAAPVTVNTNFTEKDYYKVNFSAGAGGTVTATAGGTQITSGTAVKEGTTVVFTADPSSSYTVNGWTATGFTSTLTSSDTVNTISSLSGPVTARVYFSRDKGTKSTGTYFGYFFSSSAPDNSEDHANPDNFTVYDSYVKDGHTYGYIDTISDSDKSKYIYIAAFSTKATETKDKYEKMYYYGDTTNQPWAANDFTGYVTDIGRRVKSGWNKDAQYVCFKVSDKVKAVIIDIGEAKSDGGTTILNNCYRIIPVFNDDVSKVSVYAKDGTFRGDDAYDYFPAKANTVLSGSGVSDVVSHTNFDTGVASKGGQVTVTTTITDTTAKNKYFIRGFSFNGSTPRLLNANDDGVYSSTFTIPADFEDDYLEITPIYYFKSGVDGVTALEFYIENYDQALQDTGWGNQLAVYPYYSTSHGDVNAVDNAYGGYPGNPVINYGGRRFVQVATTFKVETNGQKGNSTYTVGETATIKGITLSNYYFDRVHRFYCQEVQSHLQTYDYDDFYKIYRETTDGKEVNATDENGRKKTADQITFAFKHRTTLDNYGNIRYSTGGTIPTSINKDDFTNGWENLLDYHDRPIDIFGKQLTTVQQAKDPLLVVSNGYEYTHAGYYATTWTVYTPDGSTKIGTITPSALIISTKARMIDNSLYPDSTGRGEGYPTMMQLDDANSQTVYQALKDNYAETPVQITYEKELLNTKDSSGTYYHAKLGDISNRSDGRWFYSYMNEEIHANLKIMYRDSVDSKEYFTDTLVGTTNAKGSVTGATVKFTDTDKSAGGTYALDGYHDTLDYTAATGNVIYSSQNDTYNFSATQGSGYIFEGWGFERDGIVTPVNPNEMLKQIGSSGMTSNATFVAYYVKNPSGILNINHTVASTSIQNATTYIAVKAIKKSTNEATWLTNPSGADHFVEKSYVIDDPNYMSYKSGYKFEITLKTVPANSKVEFDRFGATGDGLIFFSTANQETVSDVTTTSFEVDVDDLFAINLSGFPEQQIETLDYFSYLKTGELKYNFTYEYTSRLYGQQTYTAKGAISETMFRNYFTFDGNNDLVFRTNALTQEFLASRAPYEDNYKQTIIWNFSNYGTGSTNYDETTGEITLESGNVTSTLNDDKTIHISFEFPYEYTVSQSITTQEDGQDPVTTPYPYDVAVTPTVKEDDAYVKAETSEKIPFVEYQAIGEDTITYRPVLQKDGVTSYSNSNKGKMQYLDWVSLSTCHHSKRDGESDPTEEPVFITAPDQVIQVTESDGQKKFTPLNFQYWSMMDKDHKEYKKCYSKEFNMAVYQTSIISPVYSTENLNAGRTTDASASITFLEYSRNQWNCGGGNEYGLTQGGANAYWKNFGDRIFTDFVLSFELKNQKLKTQDVPYRAGVVIETVGKLSDYGMETDNTYYQNAYEALNDTQKTAIKNGAKDAISSNISHAASSGNFLFSYINFNQLDNKNSAEYHYAFANVSMTRAAEEDYDSHSYDSSYITATQRKDKVYRAFSFIIDDKNTPDDISDDVVTVSTPVYFTIYDVATVADGETL